MRTTMAIDDDVLAAAKELARTGHRSVGEVISALARTALTPPDKGLSYRNGIPLLPLRSSGSRVSSEFVKQLAEELW